MDKTNELSSFLSEDIAYLLGLIIGRGVIYKSEEIMRIVINFPFKNLEALSRTKKYDTQLYLLSSIDKIIVRLQRNGLKVKKEHDRNSRNVGLIIEWNRGDLDYQLIEFLINDEFNDYHSFRIPKSIYKSNQEIQKEFMRGYFDVTGYIRPSNAKFGFDDQQRIYLEVDQRNWFLVVDLYKLLEILHIPVDSIDFGHPNFRDPEFKKQKGFWAKEHQIKIFANQFTRIGSYLEHKQDVLIDLSSLNKLDLGISENQKNYRITEKPKNPEEDSESLPFFLRHQHFDHYSQLLDYLEKSDPIKPYENLSR